MNYKTYRSAGLFFIFTFFYVFSSAQSAVKCCNDAACRQEAERLAKKILPLVQLVGPCTTDFLTNRKKLDTLSKTNRTLFKDFVRTLSEIRDFNVKDDNDLCFYTFVPSEQTGNIDLWVIYINDELHPVTFSSPEWCTGLSGRVELAQGAANFLYKDMAYLGSFRAYAIYTFGKKNSCGNRFRLMAGPAGFLQNKTTYLALSSRLGYRLQDLKADAIPVTFGNLNLFGEYTTSFHHFDYAALGLEAELGRFVGINLSVMHNIQSQHQGFLVGIFLYHK